MGHISTLGMSHDDWLRERKNGVGGSEVAAVLGLSRYKTPYDVYLDKITSEINHIDNPRMEAGRRLEPVIAQWWADKNGMKIQEDNKIRFLDDKPFIRCNIDRFIISSNGNGSGTLECKNTNSFAFKSWEDDGLPLETTCQIQGNMILTKHQWGAVAVLVDGWDIRSIHVDIDKEFQAMIIERIEDFWQNHVLKRIPPEPSTVEEVLQQFPESKEGLEINATDETYDLVQEFNRAKEVRKSAEEIEAALKDHIVAIMKNAEILRYNGNPLATYKSSAAFNPGKFKEQNPDLFKTYSRNFDGKGFKEDHPDLYEEFSEKVGSRRLLTK